MEASKSSHKGSLAKFQNLSLFLRCFSPAVNLRTWLFSTHFLTLLHHSFVLKTLFDQILKNNHFNWPKTRLFSNFGFRPWSNGTFNVKESRPPNLLLLQPTRCDLQVHVPEDLRILLSLSQRSQGILHTSTVHPRSWFNLKHCLLSATPNSLKVVQSKTMAEDSIVEAWKTTVLCR